MKVLLKNGDIINFNEVNDKNDIEHLLVSFESDNFEMSKNIFSQINSLSSEIEILNEKINNIFSFFCSDVDKKNEKLIKEYKDKWK